MKPTTFALTTNLKNDPEGPEASGNIFDKVSGYYIQSFTLP